MPTLITTDSSAQLAARAMGTSLVGRSRADGSSVFNRSDNDDNTLLWELAGAYALSDRWQIHAALPASLRLRQVDKMNESHGGLGDISAGAAFELVQELLYNPYKPRVWIYVDLVAPTGRSIYDDLSPLAANVHGRGSWGATAGVFATKSWGSWDMGLSVQHGRSLPARHTVNARSIRVKPGAVTALSLLGGYSFGDWRMGVSLGPTWEQRTVSDLSSSAEGIDKQWWSVGAQASYLWGEQWSFTASYNDQTILGPTFNASLNRSVGVAAIFRFN